MVCGLSSLRVILCDFGFQCNFYHCIKMIRGTCHIKNMLRKLYHLNFIIKISEKYSSIWGTENPHAYIEKPTLGQLG